MLSLGGLPKAGAVQLVGPAVLGHALGFEVVMQQPSQRQLGVYIFVRERSSQPTLSQLLRLQLPQFSLSSLSPFLKRRFVHSACEWSVPWA